MSTRARADRRQLGPVRNRDVAAGRPRRDASTSAFATPSKSNSSPTKSTFAKLLADVKAYLKSKPKQLDWEQMNIADIGYRLVQDNQKKYIGAEVGRWKLDLQPREKHFDKRITVATPLQKAGAYLVTAKVADGNTSQDRSLACRYRDRPQADAG